MGDQYTDESSRNCDEKKVYKPSKLRYNTPIIFKNKELNMQKLVIQTQYRENYGAHDWDGKGECPQYWKFKGGSTYVVNNFSNNFMDCQDVVAKLTKLIAYKNEASEEYILDWEIVDQSKKVCEDWESPIEISQIGDSFVAIRIQNNRGEYGWMRSEILEKTESWTMLPNSEREDYSATFLMEDGDILDYDGLEEWFKINELISQEVAAQ